MAGAVNNHPAFEVLGGNKPEVFFENVVTPAYVIDESALRRNGRILKQVMENTGCKILLAQKAFSNYDFYPMLSEYITGTEASGLFEARLGAEEMPDREVHVFCGAYGEGEFCEILKYADHIVFNSVAQLAKFGTRAKAAGKSIGIRINPQCSTQDGHAIYDPCAPGSRLGVTRKVWDEQMTEDLVELLDGLHFHTLCEQDSDDLETTLCAVEDKYGDVLPRMKWLNMGGGHHITKPGYDVARLEKCVKYATDKWGVLVYLEPGEAVALNAGFMVTRVLDIVKNGEVNVAILDASAACHMPDVIEMPYMPPLFGAESVRTDGDSDFQTQTKEGCVAKEQAGKSIVYRLAGPTCLAGDVIGDYDFSHELNVGDVLVFGDMAIYTTCKNNTFNGMALPNIYRRNCQGGFDKLTDFGYEDFKMRLGGKGKSSPM